MVNAVKVVRNGQVGDAKVAPLAAQEKEVSNVDTIVKQAVSEKVAIKEGGKSRKKAAGTQGVEALVQKAASAKEALASQAAAGEVAGGVYFKFSEEDLRGAYETFAKNADTGTIAMVTALASMFGTKATLRLVKNLHEGVEPKFAAIAKGRE